MHLAMLPSSVLITSVIISLSNAAPSGNSSLSSRAGLSLCYECTSENPRCRSTCVGVSCYKHTFTISGTDDYSEKRGCLNVTRDQQCSTTSETIPGLSGTALFTECYCAGDRCNEASSLLLGTLPSLLTVFCAYLLVIQC